MVVTANAQRAWAYDLSLTSESESYTFTFKATTAATATLILSDEEGNNVGTLDLGAVVAGSNTFTYTTDQLPKAGKMNWAVKLAGEVIAELTEVTDVNRGIYNFYLPQDVAVDNNPESDYFGQIYVAEATDGASDGSSDRADTQKRGIFVYDQELNELNPTTNVGILPSNVTLTDQSRHALHRMAVNPVDNHIAFAYNVSGSSAVWCMDPANLAGEATDLIAGLKITAANSLCFDEEGALYVLCGADGGVITKIVNGEATQFAKNTLWANADNSLVSDGKGGLWVGQNRYSVDANNALTHVNSNGESDFAVNSSSSNEIKAWFSNANGNASYRGQIAYDPARQILAFGGNKKVSLFRVSYDENEVPTIEYWLSTAIIGTNIDGLAFDYAGDLYVVSATAERLYKYAVPTNDNVCTTPAPKAQIVLNSDQTTYAVTIVVNEEAMGTVTGAGNYLAGESAMLTATANTGYRFVNWTVGEETKTENPLTLTVNSDLTVTANFAALPQYTITATANDAAMGSITGAGTYYEGEEVTLKAIANPGHEFVDWNNGATEATLTFIAAKDSAVVANFKKLSYTVTAVVNDDAKGSVSGTGTYEYGEVATVEAVAADGYELLYWSDRSTENPRTVTVDGNKVLNAYFVKEYDKEPTFKVEKLWENTNVPTSTNNGYQAAGWDQKIYMKDRVGQEILVFSDATTSATYATTDKADDQSIAADDAGNLILRSGTSAFYNTPKQVIIYKKGETNYTTIDFTLPAGGRCDFISASGDVFSEEGGYVYFYCQNKTTVNRVKIANGEYVSVDQIGNNLTTGQTQAQVTKISLET